MQNPESYNPVMDFLYAHWAAFFRLKTEGTFFFYPNPFLIKDQWSDELASIDTGCFRWKDIHPQNVANKWEFQLAVSPICSEGKARANSLITGSGRWTEQKGSTARYVAWRHGFFVARGSLLVGTHRLPSFRETITQIRANNLLI